MENTIDLDDRQRRGMAIIIAYPIVVAFISAVLNFFVLGVEPYIIALPPEESIYALVATVILLTINHSWLMTATELTRVRFMMYATPEEWAASGMKKESATKLGIEELERTHNAHRNTTENTVCFALLSLVFILSSPGVNALIVWLVAYSVARLGYTYSYLTGKDGARGLFMTVSLLCMYGIATYLAISLVV